MHRIDLRHATAALLMATAMPAVAMGLRSFVALPVDKGGTVLRLQAERDTDTATDLAGLGLAYGIDARRTLLLGLPYRLSPSEGDRLGDLSVLYRQTVMQEDHLEGTRRIGLLGGVIVPGDAARDGALQAGIVATSFTGRQEWDIDALYRPGLGSRQDTAQYDVSWQYRLTPARYPDWGIADALNGVVELGGRWQADGEWVHQGTLGLQWVQARRVVEGGLVQDLNGPHDLRLLLGLRLHY